MIWSSERQHQEAATAAPPPNCLGSGMWSLVTSTTQPPLNTHEGRVDADNTEIFPAGGKQQTQEEDGFCPTSTF